MKKKKRPRQTDEPFQGDLVMMEIVIRDARERAQECEDILAALPEPWLAAARAVERHSGGSPAAVHVALAFCRWWEDEGASPWLVLEEVKALRGRIERWLSLDRRSSGRRPGRPRMRIQLAPDDIAEMRSVQKRLLAAPEHQALHGDERTANRARIMQVVAKQFGYPNWKRLRDAFAKADKPTRRPQ